MKHNQYFKSFLCFVGIMVFWINAFASGTTDVFVSILPQKYFAQKIVGDALTIHVMVPKGANPATYEPKPRQMAFLSRCELYFAVGVPFESVWLEKFKSINPDITIIHTESGIDKMEMAAHPHHDTEKNHQGHSQAIKDPHIWISPPLVKIISKNMLLALCNTWPAYKNNFEINYKKFMDEVDQLDKDLKTVFAQSKNNKSFMVFHPAWGYFANAYGLHQIPIEMEGKEPKPAQLAQIIEQAKALGIRTIFVQPQFSAKSANVIAQAIRGKIIVGDPLAYDWENNLRTQAKAFQSE